jgi:hypothetical protein
VARQTVHDRSPSTPSYPRVREPDPSPARWVSHKAEDFSWLQRATRNEQLEILQYPAACTAFRLTPLLFISVSTPVPKLDVTLNGVHGNLVQPFVIAKTARA